MVQNILFEIAIFVFIMVAIGIGLTIYEFKAHVMKGDEKIRKRRIDKK